MTLNFGIVGRFLQGFAFAAAIDATAFAQTSARGVLMHPTELYETSEVPVEQFVMPPSQFGLLAQPPTTYVPDPALLGAVGEVRGIAPRPDFRLTFRAQNGLHVSFVTPVAPRESEQLRVQGSLAILSAYVSQRNVAHATVAPAEAAASARVDPSAKGR
jgi:hypothetical protein